MPSVSTIILRSMRMTGEKPRGATLDTNEQVECLAELNTFMEAHSNEALLCYSITQDSVGLTASTNSYTVGTNGVIATARPIRIVDPCFVRDSAGADTPVKIIDAETYGAIVLKSTGYTYPTYLYYDGDFSATSTATINLYPSPVGGLTLYFNSWKQLPTYSSLAQELMLPPGYQLFIESNFALHLCAGQIDPPAITVKIAKDSLARIKSVNMTEPLMTQDSGVVYRRRSSILTGP